MHQKIQKKSKQTVETSKVKKFEILKDSKMADENIFRLEATEMKGGLVIRKKKNPDPVIHTGQEVGKPEEKKPSFVEPPKSMLGEILQILIFQLFKPFISGLDRLAEAQRKKEKEREEMNRKLKEKMAEIDKKRRLEEDEDEDRNERRKESKSRDEDRDR